MGTGSEWTETDSGNCFGSRETHNVGISPEKDRGGTAGAVGESQGWEEEIDRFSSFGEPTASMRQAFVFGGCFTNDRMVSEMTIRAKVYAVRFRLATRWSLSLFDFSHSMSSFRS